MNKVNSDKEMFGKNRTLITNFILSFDYLLTDACIIAMLKTTNEYGSSYIS